VIVDRRQSEEAEEMNPRAAVLALLFIWGPTALPAPVQSPKETIAQFAAHVAKYRAWSARRTEALAAAKEREEFAQRQLSAVRMTYSEKYAESLRKQYQEARRERAEQRAILELARIQDPAERSARAKAFEEEERAAREASIAASEPFAGEREELRATAKRIDEELIRLMATVGKVSADHGISKVSARASVGAGGTAGLVWENAKGRDAIYLTLQLAPVTGSTEMRENVWKQFPLRNMDSSSIRFFVGRMAASFHVVDAELRGKDRIVQLGEAVIDMDALAAFRDAREKEGGDLNRKLNEIMDWHREFDARVRLATKEPSKRQNAAQERLQELALPYSAYRVEKLERQLEFQSNMEKGLAIRVAAADNDTPEKRRLARIKAEKELNEAKGAVKDAGIPFREGEIELDDSTRRLCFHVWEMMREVIRTPSELGIIQGRIDANPNMGLVRVSWRDAPGDELVRGELRLAPGIRPGKQSAKVGGKHPITDCRQGYIVLPLGDWAAHLEFKKDEWKDDEKVLELTAALVDVDAIAAWPRLVPPK
jgi:hypothetical protein